MQLRSSPIALATCAALVLATASGAAPIAAQPAYAPRDLGAIDGRIAPSAMTVTLPLKLSDRAGADALLVEVSTPGSAGYHRFLTPEQFKAKFAQSDAAVANVIAQLSAEGLSAERIGAVALKVSGSATAIERVFQVSIHEYEVPAQGTVPAFKVQSPSTPPKIPAALSAVVRTVLGLSTRTELKPHNKTIAHAVSYATVHAEKAVASGNAFGSLTVADFEAQYDVLPLASKVNGAGRTIAIVTLASFTPSDAFKYWKSLGLKVHKDRIKIVDIDGGPGAPSDASGSLETTIDVEQSGGIAPGATVIVYQSPNTNQGFFDAFVAAVERNTADSISTSWGAWEWYNNLANAPVTDPYTGETVSSLEAFHELFLQAALQGQSLFAAAGDAGAYDANDGQTPPDYSLALSVDYPGSDPYVTSSGGTTLPGTQVLSLPNNQTLTVDVPKERVWGWDYLEPLCADLDLDPIACGIFPVGSGGGVSFEFARPFYQQRLAGVQRTQPDQQFVDEDTVPPTILETLPAYHTGRNVPDVSFNADPDTGYAVAYTSDQTGYSVQTFWGGTSFVGPQLNGVVALIGQYLNGRVGLLNIPLYQILSTPQAYAGKAPPFHAIAYGNNDFYYGRDGYSPAAGVGTLNVTNFAEALKKMD